MLATPIKFSILGQESGVIMLSPHLFYHRRALEQCFLIDYTSAKCEMNQSACLVGLFTFSLSSCVRTRPFTLSVTAVVWHWRQCLVQIKK